MLQWACLIVLVPLGISACATTATANTPSLSSATEPVTETETIGWVDGACLVINNTALQPKQVVWWVPADAPKPAQASAIVQATSDPQVCPALLPNRAEVNRDEGTAFYQLAEATGPGMAIAFVEQSASEQYQVSYCVTSEGMAFKAQPKSDRQLPDWSAYYYLGYDTESTCME